MSILIFCIDGTTVNRGIEISGEYLLDTIRVAGTFDIMTMSSEDIETIIDKDSPDSKALVKLKWDEITLRGLAAAIAWLSVGCLFLALLLTFLFYLSTLLK